MGSNARAGSSPAFCTDEYKPSTNSAWFFCFLKPRKFTSKWRKETKKLMAAERRLGLHFGNGLAGLTDRREVIPALFIPFILLMWTLNQVQGDLRLIPALVDRYSYES